MTEVGEKEPNVRMRLSPAIATVDRMCGETFRLYSTASFLMGTERYRDTGGDDRQGEVTRGSTQGWGSSPSQTRNAV